MRADSEKSKTNLFFGGLAFVAVLIDLICFSAHSRPEHLPSQWSAPQTQPPVISRPLKTIQGPEDPADVPPRANNERSEARDGTSQEAAAKQAQFLAQYVNSDYSRTPGLKTVALVIISEDGKLNRSLNEAFVSRFKPDSAQILTSVFRPKFVSDGLFDKALNDSSDIIAQLELSKSLDMLLLGREDVKYSTDSSLENVVSANMRLEITAISVKSGVSQSWTFTASGSGFREAESRQMAEERLIKQISRDTKMSLPF